MKDLMYKKLLILIIALALAPSLSAEAVHVRHVDFIGPTIVVETTDGRIFSLELTKEEMKGLSDPGVQNLVIEKVLSKIRNVKLRKEDDPNLPIK